MVQTAVAFHEKLCAPALIALVLQIKHCPDDFRVASLVSLSIVFVFFRL